MTEIDDTTNASLKKCRICGSEYPLKNFFKAPRMRDGHKSECKSCYVIIRGYTPRHKSPEGTKYCARCKTDYPATIEYFYPSIRTKRKLTAYCKKCNINLGRQKPKDKQREYDKKRFMQRRQHARISKHKRRARLANLPSNFTNTDWIRCLEYWNNHCVYCGTQQGLFADTKITADHFVAITNASCPGNVPTNIVPACRSCNASKRNFDTAEWIVRKFGKRKANRIIASIQFYFEWVSNQDSH